MSTFSQSLFLSFSVIWFISLTAFGATIHPDESMISISAIATTQ